MKRTSPDGVTVRRQKGVVIYMEETEKTVENILRQYYGMMYP